MKYLPFFLVCLIFPFQVLLSQGETDDPIKTTSYTEKIIPSEYSIRFKNSDDQNRFKLLREFLKEKEAVLEALKSELKKIEKDEFGDEVEIDTSDNAAFRTQIVQLRRLIKKGADDDTKVIVSQILLLNPDISAIYRSRFKDNVDTLTVAQINAAIDDKEKNITDAIKKYEAFTKTKKILQTSISNVSNDISNCTTQIDSALAPEYQQQDFRRTISIVFSILIALLLSIFFLIVYKRSDQTLSKDLLSGNGLQFITLFVLIIAIILFGILGILQGSELAAILSGISGYILGKGTQKDLTAAMNAGVMNQPQQPN
jgi:hypothetical protein